MTPEAVASPAAAPAGLRNSWVLRLWAASRNPARAVGWNEARIGGYETRRHALLHGLVNAWIIGPAWPAPLIDTRPNTHEGARGSSTGVNRTRSDFPNIADPIIQISL